MAYVLGLRGEQPHWPEPGTPALWLTLAEDNPELEGRSSDSIIVYLDGPILLCRELDGADILEIADDNPYSIIELNVHGCSAVWKSVARPGLRNGDQVWYSRGHMPVATRRLSGAKVSIALLRLLARNASELSYLGGKGKLSFAIVRARAENLLRATLPVSLVTDQTLVRPRTQRGAAWYVARGRSVPPITLL